MKSHNETLHFNGIQGATGAYDLPPTPLASFATTTRPRLPRPVAFEKAAEAGIDASDLASAGWGVVFSEKVDPAIREALEPLIEHRRQQAFCDGKPLMKVLTTWPGESKRRFLPRYQAGPGPVDPRKVPYYLLLVGGPEEINFDLQFGLDVQYAVGRIAFERVEDYALYAQSVIDYETGTTPSPRRAAFFGVLNPDDWATQASVHHLVNPLVDSLSDTRSEWQIESVCGAEASRARLLNLFSAAPPTLLFTAGHAVMFPEDHPRQLGEQGALLCSDWPGPKVWRGGPIPEDYLFAGHDTVDLDLHGLVSFHFACFSAGTPLLDPFDGQPGKRRILASRPFMAALPQRLLSHPRGGALAMIGHIDRAWPQSFLWDEAGSQIAVFRSTLDALMDGQPVGLAMESFGQRYAEISTELAELRWAASETGKEPDAEQIRLWTAFHDARGYVIFGDPAVRLRLEDHP